MRKLWSLLLLSLAVQPVAARLGVGVMIGEPTGLNAKLWLDKTHALDFGLAWSLSEHQDMHVHADYLFHNNNVFANSGASGLLSLFYGIGGRMRIHDDNNDHNGNDNDRDKNRVGVRIPVGIDWVLPRAPVDFFMELAPVVDLMPDTHLDVEGGIGVRFWFR
ncbi:MAG: DUF3996 domain-containing protein [bacterium]|nr:DUF3996 domain-containing protein [bacterium]